MTGRVRRPHVSGMHSRLTISDSLLRLAALQSDLVTREQALSLGLSREALTRLVCSGQWLRVGTGLFSTVRTAPSWEALAWGGTLLGGPHARLGPEASGYLYSLVRKPPRPLDVLVPFAAPVRVQGPWRFIRERDGVRPARSPGSPPRLTPECTVLDLAALRSSGEVVGLVTAAVQKNLTTPDRLRRLLETRARQRHSALRLLRRQRPCLSRRLPSLSRAGQAGVSRAVPTLPQLHQRPGGVPPLSVNDPAG